MGHKSFKMLIRIYLILSSFMFFFSKLYILKNNGILSFLLLPNYYHFDVNDYIKLYCFFFIIKTFAFGGKINELFCLENAWNFWCATFYDNFNKKIKQNFLVNIVIKSHISNLMYDKMAYVFFIQNMTFRIKIETYSSVFSDSVLSTV